ncbi:hypothetical protein [Cognatishimia activa]|uniref:Uncharacterized protein n=1 Tax=Cognatishimia activa TaxID=1715691 RepID=A0A0P1IQU8_9RHOB|nr:hypothetical protein [Cognatishimia activa]CUJ17204.1 hypothetical protein TA5113_02522 [Cognatishimia activa]CUK25836.1 hypothetical protein TA5114_01640 [Cognatishimia activa]
MSLKAIVYRPARGVGFGHTLFAMSHYNAMARALSVPFFSTFEGQIYSLHGGEQGFIDTFFTPEIVSGHRSEISYKAVKSAMRSAEQANEKVLLIGREAFPKRAPNEFPFLKTAEKLEYKRDRDKVTPEYLKDFNLVYVDSVQPDMSWLEWFGPITAPLKFQEHYLRQVRETLNLSSRPYIALHARHGNGEYLDGRVSGESAKYIEFLEKIAQSALTKKAELLAEEIICLSDNAETAKTLAELSDGRVAGADNLPDEAFQKFVRSNPSQAMQRVGKIMFDFATLAGAQHIVGGESYFPRAANLLGAQDQPTLLGLYVN